MTDLIDGASALSAVLAAHRVPGPPRISFHRGDTVMTLRLTGEQALAIAKLVQPDIDEEPQP